MEFLVLVCLYGILFIIAFLSFLYRDAHVLNSGILGSIRGSVSYILSRLVPKIIQNAVSYSFIYLLYKRNSVFQGIFLVLNMSFHMIGVFDMVPILQHHYPHHNHVIWPVVAAFVNFYFWHKAWIGDPGEVTAKNEGVYNKVYQPDGVYYTEGSTCSTCDFVKPPRSKHCSVCNRCVHRFDHHCLWTNNCVGGLNHGYFIMFMTTLMAVFIQAFYKGTLCVLLYADDIKLMTTSFLDSDGSIKPITISVASQHLFLELPRLVFLVIALAVLIILLGVFLGHHIYLLLTNQTTNERYKLASLFVRRPTQEVNQFGDREDNTNVRKFKENKKGHSSNSLRDVMINYRPYSIGTFENIYEVFMPHNFIEEKLKNSKNK